MAEDWDLHAVVRGCASTNPRSDNVPDELETEFDSLDDFNFYDSGFNEDLKLGGLEEIYTSYVSPQQPQLTQPYAQAMAEPISSSFHSPPLQSASRRRKNQQTKVVREMTHEELLADSWAWRKYGQKPIKGSPYPRNYYKCSTSKGCIARKQVEKSPVDPNIYIVSYSGDHSHPRPVHRNALAGSTRNKSSTLSAPSFSMSTEGKSDSSREIRENDDVIEMEEDEDELGIPSDQDTHMGFEEHYSSYYTK